MDKIFLKKLFGVSLAAAVLTACGSGGSSSEPPAANANPSPIEPPVAQQADINTPQLALVVSTKKLTFSWNEVPKADYYRLSVNADGSSGFSQIAADFPATQLSYELDIAAHLLDWDNASYILEACTVAACVESDELSVNDLLLDAIGLITAPEDELSGFDQNSNFWRQAFGSVVALSSDGLTMAVADPMANVKTGATQNRAGLVFMYSKTSAGWVERAILAAPNADADDHFGFSLALNADGSVLAVGVPDEDSAATTVGGDMSSNGNEDSGAVYIFRKSGESWLFNNYLKPYENARNAQFGISIDLDADANTLAVGASGKDSSSGVTYIFAMDGSGTWRQQSYLKASNLVAFQYFGDTVSLNNNGDILAVGAYADNKVYLFARDENSNWSETVVLEPPPNTHYFGRSLALSGDSSTLVVGATLEHSGNAGVGGLQKGPTTTNAGAVYIFGRNSQGVWEQKVYIKPSDPTEFTYFGYKTALSNDGSILVVRCVYPKTYVFERDAGGWHQRARFVESGAASFSVSGSGQSLVLSGVDKAVLY